MQQGVDAGEEGGAEVVEDGVAGDGGEGGGDRGVLGGDAGADLGRGEVAAGDYACDAKVVGSLDLPYGVDMGVQGEAGVEYGCLYKYMCGARVVPGPGDEVVDEAGMHDGVEALQGVGISEDDGGYEWPVDAAVHHGGGMYVAAEAGVDVGVCVDEVPGGGVGVVDGVAEGAQYAADD